MEGFIIFIIFNYSYKHRKPRCDQNKKILKPKKIKNPGLLSWVPAGLEVQEMKLDSWPFAKNIYLCATILTKKIICRYSVEDNFIFICTISHIVKIPWKLPKLNEGKFKKQKAWQITKPLYFG